jgi:hypothetical protein
MRIILDILYTFQYNVYFRLCEWVSNKIAAQGHIIELCMPA